MKQAEKEIYNTLGVFEKDFGRKLTKAELGTFAVGYCGMEGGLHFDGNGVKDGQGGKDCTTSCAKGISEKGTKGSTNCSGRADATTRVMRILGFKENECGVVYNYATNHAWNWWKVSRTIYVGDPTSMGAFFVDDKGKEIDWQEVGWGSVVENCFVLSDQEIWKYTEYGSYEEWNKAVKDYWNNTTDFDSKEAKIEYKKLYPRVDFETYTQYQPISGLRTITEKECAKVIKKTGDNWYIEPSDGKKGTKWKHSTIHF